MSEEIITLASIPLPPDLFWADEFGWTPTATQLEYGITGAGFIDVSKKLTGKAITLTAEPNTCVTTRATVLALQELADQPGLLMDLNLYGDMYKVIFAPGQIPFDAEPVYKCVPPPDTQPWTITTLRLVEINKSYTFLSED